MNYLHNMVYQNQGSIQRRLTITRGFKQCESAQRTIWEWKS